MIMTEKHSSLKDKDICQKCNHYWLDFPMPLDHYEPHCEVLDNMAGVHDMDKEVPYPCLECPFNSFDKKD